MTSRIAAVVVSLPERHNLLLEALGSVYAQTRAPDDIVVGVDSRHYGECENMSRLMRSTDCDWFAFLHDDDLWHPEHLAVAESFMERADIIVARFDLEGRPWSSIEPWHADFNDLRFTNWICSPSSVVARRSVFGDKWIGPYAHYRWNDWAQWNHLLDQEARFVDTEQTTVTNRFGPWGNGSWSS